MGMLIFIQSLVFLKDFYPFKSRGKPSMFLWSYGSLERKTPMQHALPVSITITKNVTGEFAVTRQASPVLLTLVKHASPYSLTSVRHASSVPLIPARHASFVTLIWIRHA